MPPPLLTVGNALDGDLLETGEGLTWPLAAIDFTRGGLTKQSGSISAKQIDAAALIAWLFTPNLLKAVEAKIDEQAATATPTRAGTERAAA